MASINLGDRVKDRISGFEGIVIGITDWLFQCRRPIVQPTSMKDGQPGDSQSFDEDQLEVLEAGAFKTKVAEPVAEEAAPAPKTGGPRATPTRRSDPSRR